MEPDVLTRIVSYIRQGRAPALMDVVAYEAGDAWRDCSDGEVMLALLDYTEPRTHLTALRACGAMRHAHREAVQTHYDDPVESEEQRVQMRVRWSVAIRTVCPVPPPLESIYYWRSA